MHGETVKLKKKCNDLSILMSVTISV